MTHSLKSLSPPGRLITYANAVQPLVKEYDGIFIHSGAFAATLKDSLSWDESPVFLREDLEQPVMKFMTETDVFQIGRPVEQPDNDHLRTWEVAGTSHADTRVLPAGFDLGCGMMNDAPQHFVVKAALHALDLWIRDGTLPAHGELLMHDSNGVPLFDEHGIMRGGIRTPDVDVPIATYKGVSDSGDPLCGIFGETIPFSSEELKQLYPTHEDYVTKVAASAHAAREADFRLCALPEQQVEHFHEWRERANAGLASRTRRTAQRFLTLSIERPLHEHGAFARHDHGVS